MYNDELFPLQTPICPICRKAVPLNSAKTDEDGNAIHEACYLVKLGVAPRADDDVKVSNVYLLRSSLQKRYTGH
jgi:hypothetical protein